MKKKIKKVWSVDKTFGASVESTGTVRTGGVL